MDALQDGAREVVESLRKEGYTALWAGGCVRDRVMNRSPKDYDVATNAKPEEVAALFEHTVGVGAQFGVMLVVLEGERHYEVATFRAEGAYTDGRRPGEVRWADAYEDVVRRDFTINGLLYDPEREEVIDYVDGLKDLEAGIVRAIGDPHERFAEDKLRLLRAVRFSARFGFQLEPKTAAAIAHHAADITVVSAERIAAEYDRIFSENGAHDGLGQLEQLGLLDPTLPELGVGGRCDRARARFVELTGDRSEELGWATALMDLPATNVSDITLRMRMSRARQRDIGQTVALVQQLERYPTLNVAERKRLLRQSVAATALSLGTAAAAANQLPAAAVEAAKADLSGWDQAALFPPRWVDGGTLKSLGASPGPKFKSYLDALEDAQLSGLVTDEAAAREFAQGLIEGDTGLA